MLIVSPAAIPPQARESYRDEPIFSSAHQAMLFAFTYSELQHGTAGAAERIIALAARERYERELGHVGRGLKGLDGAAQAGMIKSCVLAQGHLEQHVIIARFARLSPSAQQNACASIALYARKTPVVGDAIRKRLQALVVITRRHYGLRVNLGQLADSENVDARTVRRWQYEMRRWLNAVDRRAMDEAEFRLQKAGVIPGG